MISKHLRVRCCESFVDEQPPKKGTILIADVLIIMTKFVLQLLSLLVDGVRLNDVFWVVMIDSINWFVQVATRLKTNNHTPKKKKVNKGKQSNETSQQETKQKWHR